MQRALYTFIIWIFLSTGFLRNADAENEFTCRAPVPATVREQLLRQVQERYESYGDLQAKFVQRSVFVSLNQHALSRGMVFFKKPGKMDWNYSEPDVQRFVADGRTLWFYQPGLKQVTVGEFKQAFTSDVPVSFLSGIGHLKDNFALKDACISDAGVVLSLVSKSPDPQLDEFYLLVQKDNHLPRGARIVDLGGNDTQIIFEDISLNNSMGDDRFTFSVPRGVDIIDGRAKKPNISRVLE